MASRQGLRVFAPATIANVAVGYDSLGFALDHPGDELIVREGSTEGLVIKSIHGNKTLSKDILRNTAGFAAFRLLESLNMQKEAIEIELFKNMGIGTGLGSSAASAVAGVFGVNEFLGRPYDKIELLKFATEAEKLADGSWHADNVAPCLLGSIVLVRDNDSLDCVKLPVPAGLKAVVLYPKIKILTQDSRAVLKASVSLDSHVRQSANYAAFVSALYKSDFDLMARCLKDEIIEPQRAKLIPHFYKVKKIAQDNNAIGCSISGAGPSIFCLVPNSVMADKIKADWSALMLEIGTEFDCFISSINTEGARSY